MRKRRLALVSAPVYVPNERDVFELLRAHMRYDSLEFKKATMTQQQIQEVDWLEDYEFICNFSYIQVTVDGIVENWHFDKIIRDHDEFSEEQYSVLLSIRRPTGRAEKGRQEILKFTYNRYIYLRFRPATGAILPVQCYAHATSDTNPHWGEVVALLERG